LASSSIGDRLGPKNTFLITPGGMGLSTALIGVVPSYARIELRR
jgi:MFS family permease